MKRLSSSPEMRLAALQENRYLTGLDIGILEYLTDNTQLCYFESDEVIFREGQPCLGLYIIRSGRVKIFKYSPTGREMIINICEAGDSFNEVPVFDMLDNPVSVGAVTDTQVWIIGAESLRQVINKHPQAARKIIANLAQNLRMLVNKVAELTFYPVTARLARLLYDLPPEQLSGSDRLTQDDLASRVGTVREVVARSLKDLESSGAIEIQRGKIRILNRDKLQIWD